MTIGDAISDLNNLLKAEDMPMYYKPTIKKVIETIEQEPQEGEDNDCPLDKLEQRIERIETIILALECALPNVKYVSSSHKSVVKLAYEAIEAIQDERLEKLRNEIRITIDKNNCREDKE